MYITSVHNLAFYIDLVKEARKHIKAGDFVEWKNKMVKQVSQKI
jgi:queuine tRNA-ribosyltransferase